MRSHSRLDSDALVELFASTLVAKPTSDKKSKPPSVHKARYLLKTTTKLPPSMSASTFNPYDVPNNIIVVNPTTTTVLPASHMRKAFESAFTVPQRPPMQDPSANGAASPLAHPSSPPPIPESSGPSYTHRRKPTIQSPFVGHHQDFLKIVGEDSRIRVIAQDPESRPRYHEAGVWLPSANQVFITSNRLDDQVSRDPDTGRVKGLVEMHLVRIPKDGEVEFTTVLPSVALPAANGACLYNEHLLVCDQGYGDSQTSQLSLVDPAAPSSVTPILNNFYGRPFNSLNDVIVLPDPRTGGTTSLILFTDPQYGYEQEFKPSPSLPAQVYCFDPTTGAVRALCDGFKSPNGIAVNAAGTKCYITDTGMIHGSGKINPSGPGHIYAYDIVFPDDIAGGPSLVNRSVFAMTDSGAPDGIKLDTRGNVYAGCFDGVHVWNPHGTLLDCSPPSSRPVAFRVVQISASYQTVGWFA